ncbi:MAG TPA: AAA family ATPase [Chloroflexota bacterium]|nr:AAA family ATPase [Chloroflexota bacterium]
MSLIAERLPELQRRDAYPHAASDVRLIETHISWVLLAGQYAYKLRKPVDFGFLDFASGDKRRADCEAEVELNRRLCPDLYLGVVDVVERDGRLFIGGRGRTLEPAVRMRRLADGGMLPALVQRSAADERLMERLAAHLADFHAHAASGPGVDEHASLSATQAKWDENFAQTQGFLGRTLGAAVRDGIRGYVDQFLATHSDLLERRVHEGHIRDGHGDLHAGSVCVMGRKLYLFDCIEFNTSFRCADVAAEVAFLAMDLDHLGRADLSHAFVAAYVRRSHDFELPKLLDFYKCYRAYVRGKVLSFRLNDSALAATEAERIAGEATAYFDLALAYARPLAPPLLLVAMGLPASGKSTLARAMAGRLALVHLSSDIVRKRLAGLRPTAHQDEGFECGLYTRSMSHRTYSALKRHGARWLRRGQSVVIDATCGRPADRGAFRQLARRSGARFVIVLCQADEEVLRARLAARSLDPTRTSDARLELWPALRAGFTPPADVPGVLTVDTTLPVTTVVDHVLREIRADGSARRAA